jgi:hypothetical protein
MRITEPHVTFQPDWMPLRAQEANARAPRPEDALLRAEELRPTEPFARLNSLDTDRDGWIDEDDIPYDQLMRMEAEQAQTRDHAQVQHLLHARPEERMEAEAQPQFKPQPAQPQPLAQRQPPAGPAPRIDLLA